MHQLQLAIFAALIVGGLSVWASVVRQVVRKQPILPLEPRLRVPWTGIDVLLLVLALPMLDALVIELSGARATLLAGEISFELLSAVTAAHMMWSGLAIIYLEQRTSANADEMGFNIERLGEDARLGILAFPAAFVSVYGTELIVSRLLPTSEHPLAKLVHEQFTPGLMVLAAISAIVVAPLTEELVFRVILQGWLEKQIELLREHGRLVWEWVARWVPVLVSSAAFAAMHQGYERIPIFVLGLLLGYLYHQTHRIFPSLILHACFNGLTILSLLLGGASPEPAAPTMPADPVVAPGVEGSALLKSSLSTVTAALLGGAPVKKSGWAGFGIIGCGMIANWLVTTRCRRRPTDWPRLRVAGLITS
jgi:membrane protease YdiL (CAAX protease family)